MAQTRLASHRPARSLSATALAACLAGCCGWFSAETNPAEAQFLPLQAAHLEPATAIPARAMTVMPAEQQFIVKLKDSEDITALTRLYRKDADAAREAFADWAEDDPVFSAFELASCSYSGELILRHAAAEDSGALLETKETTLTALRDHELVVYADPDFVAQTEIGLSE